MSKKDSEEKDKSKYTQRDAISISAHQIRTSMSAVKWIVEMFLGGDLGKLTVEQEKLLRKAEQSTDRAISIVSELLLVNKTEDQVEREYVFKAENIEEITEDSVFNFSGEAHNKGIEIIFLKPSEALSKVRADKDKMIVVVHNLIDNAIKYSNMHGKVFITLQEEDDVVQFSIKNKGINIKPEEKKKIFQKFYRSPEAQKKEPVGSGIGLFTIKKIVEEHGGKIWFDSGENGDTTFYFTIPIFKQR